jgi:hypothetical protein
MESKQTVADGLDGAKGRVTGRSQTDQFSPDSIFWFVNSNATKLGMDPAASCWVDMRAPFPKRCTSHIRNGHDSGFEVLAYSPGRNKK